MCSVVLKIKHTDQCAEKHSVTLMHFVQRINRRFSLCGVKLLVFLTVAPLGKCCLLNALCHFSSRTIMSPLNKTVNKLYVNTVKNCQVTKKVGYLLSIWVMSVFSRITLTHGVCLELPWLLYTLKFQTAHSVTHYDELTVGQSNTCAHNLNFIPTVVIINNNRVWTVNHN